MNNEVTNKKILKELQSFKMDVDVGINEMKSEIKKVENRIKSTENNLTDLTIITKMGFDEMGIKVDQNTHAISDINHRVTENSDRLTRVEINMNQEFAAATRQRRRILENVNNHQRRLCTLESQS